MNRPAILAVVLYCAAAAPGAQAIETRRVAIVAGNNHGLAEEVVLRFAEEDATRFAQVMRELGGVRGEDLALLLGADVGALSQTLDAFSPKLGANGTLVFYYSGHADDRGIHLGRTTLSWDELRALLERVPAALRIVLVDACQAGSVTRAKGLRLGEPLSEGPAHTGTAFLAAAEAGQLAQESMDLGGSYFTHFLISGLRGAADTNGDRLVTLAEAHSYTTAQTHRATGSWARAIQRPVYEFNISGQGDITMTELAEGTARVKFAPALEGHMLITERGEPRVIAEAHKTSGGHLELALPAGRYVIHLRRSDSLLIAEVEAPWGGEVFLEEDNFERNSYAAVAEKGGVVQIRRQRASGSIGLRSAVVDGMGARPVLNLSYARRFGSAWELGARATLSWADFAAVDTEIAMLIAGGGPFVAYEYPLGSFDLRAYVLLEAQYWRSTVAREGRRESMLFLPGLGASGRAPLFSGSFAEVSVEGLLAWPKLAQGRALRPIGAASFALGWWF